MAITRTEDGHKQTTETSTTIYTKRKKKHRTTEEETEGPTSSWGSRNRITCLTLQEHDDDNLLQIFRRVRKIAKKRLLASSCMFVCPSFLPCAWNNSAPTGWIFMKFDIWVFFKHMSKKFKFHQNQTRIEGTLREDRYTFLIISRSLLLRTKNVWDKCCREIQNTRFSFRIFSFFVRNATVYEIKWKNFVERGMLQMTTWRMLDT